MRRTAARPLTIAMLLAGACVGDPESMSDADSARATIAPAADTGPARSPASPTADSGASGTARTSGRSRTPGTLRPPRGVPGTILVDTSVRCDSLHPCAAPPREPSYERPIP